MDRKERVALQRQALPLAELCRQRVEVVDDVAECVPDERAHPLRRDLLACRVHRCEVGRRLAFADVVRLDVEAVPAGLPAQDPIDAPR